MKVPYINQHADAFLDPNAGLWKKSAVGHFNLMPTPIKMIEHLSPFMANGTEHGKVRKMRAGLHITAPGLPFCYRGRTSPETMKSGIWTNS